MSSGRYFEGSYPELEGLLENHLQRLRNSFEAKGWQGALVLGGGYGRGEGGVMSGPNGPGFSNDLDYFLFDDAPTDPGLNSWCREIERVESKLLDIDVEIKCLRAGSIGDPSRSMMFADLVAGHVVVAGNADFLLKLRENLDFSRIAPEEATRLLWNRGSGMFYSRCRMYQEDERKFVIRNHAKMKLALGDGWLCLNSLHSPNCRERSARLAEMDLPEELAILKVWHSEGVEFKFRPFSGGVTWAELEAESRRLIEVWGIVYLAVERHRLKKLLPDFSAYLSVRRLLVGTSYMKNLTLALRDQFERGGHLRPLGDYPRAGLMRALPCLLGLTPGGIAECRHFLPSPAGDRSQAVSWEGVYSKWWAYYS